jgi:hypothetical protein
MMGFVFEFIGRPPTALNLMNTIRDKLVAAGWTLLWEGQDSNGNNIKYLRTAPFIMPDGSDAGSAVLELRNPVGTNHVDLKMWNGWDSQTGQPVAPSCPNENSGNYQRLAYSYLTIYYFIYANEYWFALLVSNDSIGSGISGSNRFKTLAGIAVPPEGIPTAPQYKALFVVSPYDTNGSLRGAGFGTEMIIYSTRSQYDCILALNIATGSPTLFSWLSPPGEDFSGRYSGHPDYPPVLVPLFLASFGIMPYAMISSDTTTPIGTQFQIGNELWVNIISGYQGGNGQIYVRIS